MFCEVGACEKLSNYIQAALKVQIDVGYLSYKLHN